MDDKAIIARLKEVTKASRVRPLSGGDADGYSASLDGQAIQFRDEADAHRVVPTAALAPPPPPAPAPEA